MIKDTISNAATYYSLGPRIEAGLRYLADTDLNALEPGRYDIMGDECFVLVMDYETQPREAKRWETHRRYIDIQFVASGTELMGYTNASTLQSAELIPEKDLEFYAPADGDFLRATPGTFFIFHPQDAHMPGVAGGEGEMVRKVVVKAMVG